MAKRGLVTGGAGFIGSHLADRLLDAGWTVRVLDALSEQVHGPGARRPACLDDANVAGEVPNIILFVTDLVDAFLRARDQMDRLSGRAFNLGGGADRAVSLLELLSRIEALGATVDLEHGPWRVGDQRWYVSDTRAFRQATGWAPKIGVREGLVALDQWVAALHGPPTAVPAAVAVDAGDRP